MWAQAPARQVSSGCVFVFLGSNWVPDILNLVRRAPSNESRASSRPGALKNFIVTMKFLSGTGLPPALTQQLQGAGKISLAVAMRIFAENVRSFSCNRLWQRNRIVAVVFRHGHGGKNRQGRPVGGRPESSVSIRNSAGGGNDGEEEEVSLPEYHRHVEGVEQRGSVLECASPLVLCSGAVQRARDLRASEVAAAQKRWGPPQCWTLSRGAGE